MKLKRIFSDLLLFFALVLSTRPLVIFAQVDQETQQTPEWVKNLQYRAPDGYRYFVGVYSDASTREEALERSWYNTLISIARSEFPFLQIIKQSSIETLTGAEYRREAALAVERVKFDGVTESQDKLSPFIVTKKKDGKEVFTAYRLLRWSSANIRTEFDRLKIEDRATQINATIYDSQIGTPNKPTGLLRITTKPAGAQILLDGEPLGRSNASFSKVSEGSYKLLLQIDGYEVIEKKIYVRPGERNEENFILKKLKGTSKITSSPEGALVFVDNVPVGRTPTEVHREFGTGNIRIELEDYFSESKEISFSHQINDESFSLRPKNGKISVLSTPNGATVKIDDKVVGKTPLLGYVSAGGNRKVTVSMEDFEEFNTSVIIRSSRSISLAPVLFASSKQKYLTGNARFSDAEKNIFHRMAPIGKWVAGGTTLLSAILYYSASSSATTSFQRYNTARTTSDAVAARREVENYDASASIWKTVTIASGLVTASFLILDWNSDSSGSAKLHEQTKLNELNIGLKLFPSFIFQKKDLGLSLRLEFDSSKL